MSIKHLVQGKVDTVFIRNISDSDNEDKNPLIEKILDDLDDLIPRINTSEIDKNCKIPDDLINDLFEMGILALFVPQELGGIGSNMRDFCDVIQKISEVDVSIATTIVPHSGMGVKSILYFANDEQKKELLGNLSSGKKIISFALTEIQAGSDVANHTTMLRKISDDEYVLNGIKHFITNASYASTIVVVAKCPDLSKIPGGSVFVYLKPEDKGLFINHPYDKMGMRGSDTSELVLQDIKISKDRIIGIPGKAISQFNMLVDSGRMGVSSVAMGVAKRILKICSDKYKNIEKSRFLDGLLDQINTRVFQMEACLYITAASNDFKLQDSTIYTAINKLFCTKSCQEIINYGFNFKDIGDIFSNQEVFLALRDSLILRVTEGPNEVINYKASIDIITSLINIIDEEESIVGYVHEDLKNAGKEFDGMIKRLKDEISGISDKYENFTKNQFVLNRVIEMVTPVFVFFSCIVYYSKILSGEKKSNGEKDGIIKMIYATRDEMKCLFDMSIGNEERNIDEILTEIHSYHTMNESIGMI